MWKLNNTGIAYTKKHKNDIIDKWNEDSKCIYKEFIENEKSKDEYMATITFQLYGERAF